MLNPLLSVSRQRTIIGLVLGRRVEGIHSDEPASQQRSSASSFFNRKEQERPLPGECVADQKGLITRKPVLLLPQTQISCWDCQLHSATVALSPLPTELKLDAMKLSGVQISSPALVITLLVGPKTTTFTRRGPRQCWLLLI